METLGDKKTSKKEQCKFFCNTCDYKCCRKSNLSRHILTAKHLRVTKGDINEQNEQLTYDCKHCQKRYTSRNGLWKHNKKCHENVNDNADNTNNALVEHFTKENKGIMEFVMKENKDMKEFVMEIIKNGTITNNNVNNINNVKNVNKSFNINFFLNETCKDAMNISDFIDTIKVDLDDLERTGRQGYIQGISNIFLKHLNDLEQHYRPLHCSDSKREVFYIKDKNEWTKEADNKPILTSAIKKIANENIKQIKNWKDKYPDCTHSDSKKNDMYLKIVSNSMNGLTEEEGLNNINKIISNVAKEVTISK